MDNLEELFTVEMIKLKQAEGEKLTEREEIILAYSPYAHGGSCHACAH
jgi:hypothetical protein